MSAIEIEISRRLILPSYVSVSPEANGSCFAAFSGCAEALTNENAAKNVNIEILKIDSISTKPETSPTYLEAAYQNSVAGKQLVFIKYIRKIKSAPVRFRTDGGPHLAIVR